MNEEAQLIADSAARLFGSHCTSDVFADAEAGVWPRALWEHCEAAGLADAALHEDPHQINIANAAVVVRVASRHAAPLPLAETILARMMLSAAHIVAPDGPLTIGPALADQMPTLTRDGSGWVLSGRLDRLPWSSDTGSAILAHDGLGVRTVLLPRPLESHRGWNYAREPRDRLLFNDVVLPNDTVGGPGEGWSADTLLLWGALFRAVAMAGAMEPVLDMTLRYATDRVQFGRPIGKFQAVQQQIAVLASHVAAANAAVQGAVDASSFGPAAFEIAAAKLRVGEAAGIVSEIAHQVHGAMGFTHEHTLHRFTRRLWSWRDEFGSESDWAIRIGRLVCGLGGEALWPFLTDPKN